MKDKDLQNIWKKIDFTIENKSKEDLNQLLDSKSKKTINKYVYHFIISAVVSIGLITFLIFTMIHRWDDLLYRLNNLILCFFTLLSLMGSVSSINNLKNNKSNLSLKEWIKYRIDILSKWIYNKVVYYLIPLFYIFVFVSIHVYYEKKQLIEIVKDFDKNSEAIYSLSFGLIIGLTVSFFVLFKIKQNQRKNLKYLENLYEIICDSNA